MKNVYKSFRCSKCRGSFVTMIDDYDKALKNGNYISCPYCGSKRLKKDKVTDDLRECMSARKYKRERGAIKEV